MNAVRHRERDDSFFSFTIIPASGEMKNPNQETLQDPGVSVGHLQSFTSSRQFICGAHGRPRKKARPPPLGTGAPTKFFGHRFVRTDARHEAGRER